MQKIIYLKNCKIRLYLFNHFYSSKKLYSFCLFCIFISILYLLLLFFTSNISFSGKIYLSREDSPDFYIKRNLMHRMLYDMKYNIKLYYISIVMGKPTFFSTLSYNFLFLHLLNLLNKYVT